MLYNVTDQAEISSPSKLYRETISSKRNCQRRILTKNKYDTCIIEQVWYLPVLLARIQLSVVNLKPKLSRRPIGVIQDIKRSHWELRVKTWKLIKCGKNASDQVAIGFSSAPDWSKRWREFSEPTTEQRRAKPWQPRLLSKIDWKLLYWHASCLQKLWI